MSDTDQPMVSILTPVHNGATYLRECIESVQRQTYRNWEYVIVDNRSTDETLAIAEEYARRDSRIRVITNKNLVGVITNHNIAFQEMSSTSRFCKVVHADDWLFPECVEKMVEVAMANPSIGLVSAYTLEGTKIRLDGLAYPSGFVCGRQIARAWFLGGPLAFGCPTWSMVRSDIVRRARPFYNKQSINADTEAGFAVLTQSDFGFVHQVLTFTRLHEQSVTSRNTLLDPFLPGHLVIVLKYGPVFLTATEFAAKRRVYMREYYSCLARRALRVNQSEYWKFHKESLKRLGISVSLLRIAATVPIEIAKLCFSPKRLRRMMRSRLVTSRQASGDAVRDL
jgi:glycosyltransferase involved in cell wall biosynthesis